MIKVISKLTRQYPVLATKASMHTSATQAIAQLAIRLTSGDKEPVRVMQMPDDSTLFSVYDVMWNTGAYHSRDAVTSAWTTLLKSEFKEDIQLMARYLQFPGPRQRKTPCVDVCGLLKLMPHLSRKMGKAYWREAQLVLERYLDGDTSMCVDMEENKRIGGDDARALFALKVEARAAEMTDDDDDEEGYVYGMVSDAFPGLIKIGHTRDLDRRLVEANTFCSPMPFRYVATHHTSTPRLSETHTHKHFEDLRRAGEFFEVDVSDVIAHFAHQITSP
jgi:Meiotically up-regulated gene 113